MVVYLDTNIFYNAYCPVEDSAMADWILEQLTATSPGITCEWTLAEIFRAFKKQVNLGVIEEEQAQNALDYLIADLEELVQTKTLRLIPVTYGVIMATRTMIFTKNLYAADAVHAIIALNANAESFITYDKDFKGDLGGIPILNPGTDNFQESFLQYKSKS